MQLLHLIRKASNVVLSPIGLALQRVEKKRWFQPTSVTTQVGKYSIEVPSINPIATHYSQYPDYAGFLGRVTLLLKKKYPDMGAIDIGANVGDTACIIKSGADIPVLCIEGDDFTFGFLEKNLRQFQNAEAHQLFLGEKTEAIAASFEKNGWNATLKPDKADASPNVKLVSLDDFLADLPGCENRRLVKIDTEGFDCSIIRGAKVFLQEVHPVITFEYNRDNMNALGEKGLDTLGMLAGLGYSQMAIHDCDGRFFSMASLSDVEFFRDIHDYADGRNAAIYYFDLTLFHESDKDVAALFAQAERKWRVESTQQEKPAVKAS